MKSTLLSLALASGFALPAAACPNLEVTDGDTIRCGAERIRIMGLDIPEIFRAKCAAERAHGLAAKERLGQLLQGHEFRIERHGRDKYGRTLARLHTGGLDVADIMISEGYAREYHGPPQRRRSWCGSGATPSRK